MEQIKTARKMLAQIEKDFFKGAGLAEASLLKGEERRTYRLAQVERLLTVKHAIGVYEYGHYLPAQDELAELFSTKYNNTGSVLPL